MMKGKLTYIEKKRAITDIIVLSSLSLVAFSLIIYFDAFEAFYIFSRNHEKWHLDEIVFASTIVFSVSFGIFSTRRWRDVRQLVKLANYDSLTGLFNRRKGVEIITEEMNRVSRYERSLSLIMFDLDHFKIINDNHGHLKGDEVLKMVSFMTQSVIRSTDFLVRWGGEEFLIVCPETDVDGARELAERIRREIRDIHFPDLPGVTASFGVHQMEEADFFDFIHSVDEKLYQAKASGRDSVAS